MLKYRVVIRGEDFTLSMDGQTRLVGFYQTHFVEASSPEQAELVAVKNIRQGDLSDLVIDSPDKEPRLFLEELEEIDTFGDVESLAEGRSFFLMEEPKRHWWQIWKRYKDRGIHALEKIRLDD